MDRWRSRPQSSATRPPSFGTLLLESACRRLGILIRCVLLYSHRMDRRRSQPLSTACGQHSLHPSFGTSPPESAGGTFLGILLRWSLLCSRRMERGCSQSTARPPIFGTLPPESAFRRSLGILVV